MRKLLRGLGRYVAFAAFFSLAINLLLLAPPLYMLQVFDRVLTSRSGETLVMLTLAAALALAVMAALDAVRACLLAALGTALDRLLGATVLERLLAEAARTGGERHGAAMRDVNCLRGFLGGAGVIALFDAPWLPLFLLLIVLFHPLLGAVALAGALVMLALAWLNERLTRAPLESAQAQGRRAGRFIDTAARNAEAVAALGMLAGIVRRWGELNAKALQEQGAALRSGAALSGLTKLARQLIQTAMLGIGAYVVLDQQVTGGVMIAATILLGRALAPVEQLVAGWRNLVEARAAWRRLDELLGGATGAEPATALPAPKGELRAEGVVFGFRDSQRPAVRGVSFELPPGEALAIVGPSASGKSTLVRLIAGVWWPASGTMRLDGADVGNWPRASLAGHLGYLPQAIELLPGTVAQNIARLQEPQGDAVIGAARRAHVHEMILRLARGYDTDALELSPGQRQRVALARALYGEPRVVVLDEPNSSLDQEGEQALAATLRGLKGEGVTLVVVAHRPSLLASADKVLVLRDGALEAFGPRDELLSRIVRRAA